MQQTLLNGAITATTVTMYEYGKRNVAAIQQFLGITEDGSYGPQTTQAVKEFQQELIGYGYLSAGDDDGSWGPKTDAAFREYVSDNAVFLYQN